MEIKDDDPVEKKRMKGCRMGLCFHDSVCSSYGFKDIKRHLNDDDYLCQRLVALAAFSDRRCQPFFFSL